MCTGGAPVFSTPTNAMIRIGALRMWNSIRSTPSTGPASDVNAKWRNNITARGFPPGGGLGSAKCGRQCSRCTGSYPKLCAAWAPARLPLKMQSAIERPLT